MVCRNPNIRNFDDKGNPDKFSELLLSICGIMYSFEKENILSRVREGVRLKRMTHPHLYVGRRINSGYTPEQYLQRKKSIQIMEYLNKGTYTYKEISKILSVSETTISKVKRTYKLVNG